MFILFRYVFMPAFLPLLLVAYIYEYSPFAANLLAILVISYPYLGMSIFALTRLRQKQILKATPPTSSEIFNTDTPEITQSMLNKTENHSQQPDLQESIPETSKTHIRGNAWK